MKNTTNHLEDNIHRGLIVAVLFLLLLSSACIGMGSKPKLSIKDLTIDKQEKRSIWSSFCSVDIKGLVKNEGNKEARSPYVMCKYYVGDKLIDTDRKDFGWSGIYPNAEEPFSFYKSFDSGSCEKLRIECEAYCKNC